MSVNYGALRGDAGGSALPEDGLHVARLQDTFITGSRLKTTWVSLETGLMFEVWWELQDTNRWAGNRRAIDETIDLLDGLGINRAELSVTHPVDDALNDCIGRDYQVSTQRWRSQSGSEGINLVVEDRVATTVGATRAPASAPPDYRPAPEQQQFTDVPVPASETAPPAQPYFDKDDIPF